MPCEQQDNPIQVASVKPVVDIFLYRLLGAICAGFSLCVAVYAMSLAFQIIPRMEQIFEEFEISASRKKVIIFQLPWIPLAVSTVAIVLSLLATISIRRRILVLGWLFMLASLGMCILYRCGLSSDLSNCIRIVFG